MLFSGMTIRETHLFRVTRNADLELEEDEADDLLLAIEEELRRRRFGEAVRLEVGSGHARLDAQDPRAWRRRGPGRLLRRPAGMLDHTGLWQLAGLDRPDLKLPPYTPVVPTRLAPPDEDEPSDVFAAVRAGDILVHHPYESFRRLRPAVHRPGRPGTRMCSRSKMTLYRTSGDSPSCAT